MNALIKWNPFKEMDELQDRLGSWLTLSPFRYCDAREQGPTLSDWVPAVDIAEDNNEYLIKAELPELKKEDVNVRVENGLLTITGERKLEKEDQKYHRVERAYGRFERSFRLPENVDPDKVSAQFKDGVLRVHVPKDEAAKPKAIEVKVA